MFEVSVYRMNRRAAIVFIGTVLCGCTSTESSDGGGELESDKPSVSELKERCETNGQSNPATNSRVRTPDVAIGVDQPRLGLFLDVELLEGFTEEHPAKIKVILGNNATSERVLEIGGRPISHGRHLEHGAEIFSNAGEGGYSLENGCWTYGEELVGAPVIDKHRLNPGETLARTYTLPVPKDADACLPDGIYIFSARVAVRPPEQAGDHTNIKWAICLNKNMYSSQPLF
jgi:hypothetical protein